MNQPPEYPSDPQQPPVPPGQSYYPPQQQYPPQPGYPPYQQPRPKKKRSKFWLIVAVVIGAICVIGSFSHGATSSTTTTDATAIAPTQQATAAPTKAPTTPPTVQYPPKTVADLHGLAAQGTMSTIHEFHSESVGMTGACPQPKRLVTVDLGITGKPLAEDLLAYFYGQQLDSPCGTIAFAYHNQSEANDVYTAGRIKFDVTDASGADNFDPNATGLTHKLTLDVGGLGEKEYVVTY